MFDQLMGRVAGRFARVEPRQHCTALVLGLLSGLPKKNCWTLAEHAGDATPDGMQHLLHRAKWDADAVRDDVRAYVVEHLRDDEAVLVAGETGDLKKGTATAGVQRQYTGTAGRIENSQVAVYLVYSAARGHAAIDRALYVPRSRANDPGRCRVAGVPNGLAFAAKPQLAARMITRALDVGTPTRWVAGDEFYGDNPHLRSALETRPMGYVLTVSSTHQVVTHAGKFQAKRWSRVSRSRPGSGCRPEQALKASGTTTGSSSTSMVRSGSPGHWWLLVRRNRRSGDLAFYRCFSPRPVPLSELVRVAGRRWTVEETFQAGKGLAGLDEHQVRRWTSFTALISHVHDLAHRLRWSKWRRRHPNPSPQLALPTASSGSAMKITIYGWSVSRSLSAHWYQVAVAGPLCTLPPRSFPAGMPPGRGLRPGGELYAAATRLWTSEGLARFRWPAKCGCRCRA
jgi:SRSO17 transposase